MYDDNYALNQCLANPGLAINAGSATIVKYANTFTFKANGRLSPSITSAAAPALTGATLVAPYPNGTASTVGSLATGYQRTYTLIGTLAINGTATVTPTFSWFVSPDTVNNTDVANVGTVYNPNQSNQCVIGYVVVNNNTGSAFVPGTTALDASNLTVTYVNNYAYVGA